MGGVREGNFCGLRKKVWRLFNLFPRTDQNFIQSDAFVVASSATDFFAKFSLLAIFDFLEPIFWRFLHFFIFSEKF